MESYKQAYQSLNQAQRLAVDTIDGPVLVIAGPGTGKTQLLSARVAHILNDTDTPPQNILCLTFTENGAQNMRDRLSRFIGRAAYDVTISTYHAFGGDIIRRFPEYFTDIRLESPVDDLGKRQILADIVDQLPYQNPLKQTRHHLGDLMATISELKRALLDKTAIIALARENHRFIESASKEISQHLAGLDKMPSSYTKALPYFMNILDTLTTLAPKESVNATYSSLGAQALLDLAEALEKAAADNKSTPLTKWKNKWLSKNTANQYILSGELENRRLQALGPLLNSYQNMLAERGLYDFDDMILRAIEVLDKNPSLKYSLQEQYLYILLDEYQDTNAAQAKLISLLSDNPVNEGRPNIMAVGDDDQAIYAFQGAEYSNMREFYDAYRDTAVINLTENYRSTPGILQAAEKIAEQIENRLAENFPNVHKSLISRASPTAVEQIERINFSSDINQFTGIASRIQQLIKAGTSPSEIAVLAPKHKQLEILVPYLNALGIPVSYEKRENILEAPVIRQLITMSRLVLAIATDNSDQANALWPEVLSYPFWKIPTATIWQIAWQVSDSKSKLTWNQALLDDIACAEPIQLILSVAGRVASESCETILDYLLGNEIIETNDPTTPKVSSPLREYYLDKEKHSNNPELFYDTLSHLIVLRAKLRAYEHTQSEILMLPDLLSFIDMYLQADQQLVDTNPHNQATDSVQLMTVFKAKGLEFEHVFLPSCQNDVWGSSSRGNSNKLTLPPNLAAIRHAGATEDERLRILFVAITRARIGLYLTSYDADYAGKKPQRLKYFDEYESKDNGIRSCILPDSAKYIIDGAENIPRLEALELEWHGRHVQGPQVSVLRALLHNRLSTYQLSPTHLTTFIDMEYGGPESFFLGTLLRFPTAPTIDSEFGNAIHETMEWIQHYVSAQTKLPSLPAINRQYEIFLNAKRLPDAAKQQLQQRGKRALELYVAARGFLFKPADLAEKNFRNENVFLSNVHLAGKIDRLEIDAKNRTITVVDYKTGKSYSRWTPDAKLHRYQLQLNCYKLLVEQSRSFRDYKVTAGRLEFIEPDENGLVHALELRFDQIEMERTQKLLKAMWQHVQDLHFPSTASYSPNITGIRNFEQDLLEDKI